MNQKLSALGLKILILFSTFHATSYSYASSHESISDARSLSLSGVQAVSHELANPAYLSFCPQIELSASLHNKFEMKELNTVAIQALLPNKYINIGIKISEFGYTDYHSLSCKVGFSKKITRNISLGANIENYNISSKFENNIQSNITTDIGLFVITNKSTEIGLLVKNIATNASYNFPLFHAGINYYLNSSCGIIIETDSDFKNFHKLVLGFEYELMDKLYFRGGIQTSPKSPSLGCSYSLNIFTIDVGFQAHQVLGNSSAMTIIYHF